MAIQRNTLVPPFSTNTPFLNEGAKSNLKKARDGQSAAQPSSSNVSFPHTKFFQSLENAANASAQITDTIPASSAAVGQPGTIAFDANWLYVCVGLNIWKRAALSSF